MNNQFKPGDLALVVGCHRLPTLIGSVVELFAKPDAGGLALTPDGSLAAFEGDSAAWIVLKDGHVSINGDVGWALVSEIHLMPLRGDFQPERQQSREVSA